MSDSKEVKAVKGLTMKALVFATIGLIFAALLFGDAERAGPWAGFQDAHDPIDVWGWQAYPVLGAYGVAWAFMIVIAFINQGARAGRWKIRFSGQEVALMSVMIVLGGVFNGYYRGPFKEWFSEGAYVARQAVSKQAGLWKYVPSNIFGPQDPVTWRFYTGVPGEPVKARTLAIPWVDLAPMMVLAISFISSGMLYLVFASMLLRRLYCTVEYLPMPLADITTELVNLTQTGSEKVRFLKSKPFLLGFLLCFIYMFPIHGLSFYQTLATGLAVPRQYGRLGGVLLYPIWDFTPNKFLPWVPLYITLVPWEIGWGLLLPVNVLVSALIGWFPMFVIVPVALSPYLGPQSNQLSVLLTHGELDFNAIGFSYSAIFIGMLVAMVIVPVIRNRRHLIPIFKALVTEPAKDFDPDRPISYRLTWLLTIGFGLLWYLIGTLVINMRFDAFLIHSIMLTILFIGGGRLVLETGGYYGNFSQSWMGGVGDYVGTVLLKGFSVVPSKGQVSNIVTSYYMNSSRMNMYGCHENIPWYSINSMKIADVTKTRTSDILKVLTVGIVISMTAVAIFHFVWRAYSPTIWWKIPGIYFLKMSSAETGILSNAVIISKWDAHLTQVTLGFVIVTVLSLLQPRLSLLRSLSIGGLVFGAWAGYTVWVPWLIALVVKYIVLRTGGIKMYQETVKPFSLGLVAGALLILFVMQLGNFLVWVQFGIGR